MSEEWKKSATIPCSSSSAAFFDPARLPPRNRSSYPDVPTPSPSQPVTEDGDAADEQRQASASLTISSPSLPLVQQVDNNNEDGKVEVTAEKPENNVVDKKELVKSPTSALNSFRTPSVTWKQTVDSVILTVHIVDMKGYSLEVMPDHRTLSLRTTSPEGYGFDLVTFGRVTTDFEVKTSGQYSTIVLKKFVKWIWLRLTKDKIRCRWITADQSNKGVFLEEEDRDSDDNSEGEDDEDKAQEIIEGMLRLWESGDSKKPLNAIDSDDEIGSDEEELLFS